MIWVAALAVGLAAGFIISAKLHRARASRLNGTGCGGPASPVGQIREQQRESEMMIYKTLAHADCVVWQARVVKRESGHHWEHLAMPKTRLSELLFGDRVYSPERGFWDTLTMPDSAEMERRYADAFKNDEPGYDQQFRAITRNGREFWLSEQVSITKIDPGIWELDGVITDVTGLRKAEESAKRSESQLAHLLERADTMLWQAQVTRLPDGTANWEMFIPKSQVYRRIFSSDPQNPVGFAWDQKGVVEADLMAQRAETALVDGLSGYEQVIHVPLPSGHVWLHESVTILPTSPASWDLVGIITDITAKHQAESAREMTEFRLQNILARADCLLWEAEVELAEWKWQLHLQPSGLGARLYGPGPHNPDSLPWIKLAIPELAEMDRRCRTAMMAGDPGYDQVFRIIRDDGTDIWIRENVSIRRLSEDRYSLVGVAVDISPQRRAEAALAAEKERLSVTLRAMGESVISTDVSGRIQFMNQTAAALTGWPEDACIGRQVERICPLVNAKSEHPMEALVARVIKEDALVEFPGETWLVDREGKRRMIEGCGAPIHATDHKLIGTVLVLRDVTEQERLAQELVRATRLESVGLLAGGIAHDFNNILTAVMGNLTLAQLDLPANNPATASLLAAEKAALRARDLTQQLLTFARGGEPVRAAVQLDATIREMAAFALLGANVRAHYEIAPDLWLADADKGQIGRVVQNMVINAVQAMPGGGMLRILAHNDSRNDSAQPGLVAGDYVQIVISDTGEGIQPEHLLRIFDPYFTTKNTGTGLGLAAVYSIVKKHRGHIEVESEPGRGTTFRLWLPALRDRQRASVQATPHPQQTTVRLKGRVLFMDDESSIRQMAGKLLQRFGLEVTCVSDGMAALQEYRSNLEKGARFDLVIMDLTIPGGMGGLAALAKLRELDPAVRAVVSSGYSSDPVMANFRVHGFVARIAKPYESHEMAHVLRELLPAV
jgi:PAS domain S-box-containing protein